MDKTKDVKQAAEEIKDFVDALTEGEQAELLNFVQGVKFTKSLGRGEQESA